MANGLKKFLKYVLERSKGMNGGIHCESGGDDCENLLNELLLHVDLLDKTVLGNCSTKHGWTPTQIWLNGIFLS